MSGRPALPLLPSKTKPVFRKGPRSVIRALSKATDLSGPGNPPTGWPGDEPEWWAFWALERLGEKPNLDFIYQSSAMGGRLGLGGAVLDFEMLDPPGLGININGVYWHYRRGTTKQTTDAIQRAQLASRGITLITIDDDDLKRNPTFYVSEALRGIDHSRIARGLGSGG